MANRLSRRLLPLVAASLSLPLLLSAPDAQAFCGFYVSGGTADLFNNATQVVLMRVETTTVLSMQNNYQGPPENFAMVIPVPVVLGEDDVRILPHEVFDHVDQMTAPRLVEYWERDPCYVPPPPPDYDDDNMYLESVVPTMAGEGGGVVVEAEFAVGEYDVVILSADDSTALDAWLIQNEYRIPENAEPLLRPYVAAGSKFFVAKVDIERVTFEDDRAVLSPLRFHYDTQSFDLPVRLGLINANGAQDLIVNILAPNQRYEVANYDNVTIPTNIEVLDEVRENFGAFYTALFDATLERNPNAVITEYSWAAQTCDPCPGPTLSEQELQVLGADVTGVDSWNLVVTRLHARYEPEGLSDDLIFREAPSIVGGREFVATDGQLEYGALPADRNNFQARYIIRHHWDGPIECENPVRGIWMGPPPGVEGGGTAAAEDLAFAPRGGASLASYLAMDVPEVEASAPEGAEASGHHTEHSPSYEGGRGCFRCGVVHPIGGWSLLALAGLALGLTVRRRRQ